MAIRFIENKVSSVRASHARRKEARPGELLDAALALFVEKGFAATRSEEVAARAGVSKGTLFLYFPSKEELFKAVVRENISGRFNEWNQAFENFEGSTADMVRFCFRTWWDRVGNTPASGITKLMLSEGRNFPEIAAIYQQEVVHPAHVLLKRILQRGIDSGEFRPMNLNYAVYSIVAPMVFLTLWKHSARICTDTGFDLDPEAYLAMQLDNILLGMSSRKDAP